MIAFSPNSITEIRRLPLTLAEIPAWVAIDEQLTARGWSLQLLNNIRSLQRKEETTNGQRLPDQYWIVENALYAKGDDRLLVAIRAGRVESRDEALSTAIASLLEIFNHYPMQPGKGQLNLARTEAKRLLEVAQSLPGLPKNICVLYHTRGGRGGWKQKIARRVFTPAEVTAPTPKTRAQQFPSIRCIVAIGVIAGDEFIFTERLRPLYLRSDDGGGVSSITWGHPFRPDESPITLPSGEVVRYCLQARHNNSVDSVLRVSEADYQRLLAKQ